MKVSVLTAAYNRANTLTKLYESLVENSNYAVEIEWLIMDDGSTDKTKEIVKQFKQTQNLQIQYYHQENQGKMKALNNLNTYVTGELMLECDSDDYFTPNAFNDIREHCNPKQDSSIYAYVFLKQDQNKCNMGNLFPEEGHVTKMFDLYFKEGEDGEKALVYNTSIRKQQKYLLEKEEKFGTEARLHHLLDKRYRVKCFNKTIMTCEYQQDGYTKNIKEIFQKNPYGYFAYFKEMFDLDMKGIVFSKRLYIIKHYILFSYLTHQKGAIKYIKGIMNKVLYLILWIPGMLKTKFKFGKREDSNG